MVPLFFRGSQGSIDSLRISISLSCGVPGFAQKSKRSPDASLGFRAAAAKTRATSWRETDV